MDNRIDIKCGVGRKDFDHALGLRNVQDETPIYGLCRLATNHRIANVIVSHLLF